MTEVLIIAFSIFLYALLVLLWMGRERLKIANQFKGVIGISYTAILGVIGASIFILQKKLFISFEFTPNSSFALSILSMLVICIPLYMVFIKNQKLEDKL